MEAVYETIGSICNDLANLQLPDDAGDDRSDAVGEFKMAVQAGREGKRPRMEEKLESAQRILLKIGGMAGGGIELAETVGVLIQRLLGM